MHREVLWGAQSSKAKAHLRCAAPSFLPMRVSWAFFILRHAHKHTQAKVFSLKKQGRSHVLLLVIFHTLKIQTLVILSTQNSFWNHSKPHHNIPTLVLKKSTKRNEAQRSQGSQSHKCKAHTFAKWLNIIPKPVFTKIIATISMKTKNTFPLVYFK